MRGAFHKLLPYAAAWLLSAGSAIAGFAAPRSELVDRIVARVDSDIILLSEVRELAAYQQLVDGHAETEEQLLGALIEQWAVRTEAQAAQFSTPAAADVEGQLQHIQSRFSTPQAYRERLAALGLSPQSLRRIVEQQLYLARYLDYKFRPAVQVDEELISRYYQEELVPALQARGQAVPPLDDLREQIRELLVQRGISERADIWFEETKSRLQIEIVPPPRAGGKP